MIECNRCLMNNSIDVNIEFDEHGICNHCNSFDQKKSIRLVSDEDRELAFSNLISKIKKSNTKGKYNCIVGVSGGVDSSYVAYLAKKNGLRPLCIHLDNGWNSELAVDNIQKILTKLDIPLYTHVIDWNEFRKLQLSFLKSGTPDGEIPSDHAIQATLWQEASKRGIKYILSGMNFSTESIAVETNAYGHYDWKYIKSVHKLFEDSTLKTYPRFSLLKLFYYTFIKNIRIVGILNYINYSKDEAVETLKNELGWRSYSGKHHESVYTRFFQGYFLPKKFNIDKRIGHLSDLIKTNQISKDEARKVLLEPTYDLQLQADDKEFALKKLKISEKEFDEIINSKNRTFREYPNNYGFGKIAKKTADFLRGLNLYPK